MPDYTSPDKMGFLWFTEDGRVLYLLPWEGSTLAGTTDAKVTPRLVEASRSATCAPSAHGTERARQLSFCRAR
eukprot:scaffold55166_cov30-Tisochrysis_lutea.AAC.5